MVRCARRKRKLKAVTRWLSVQPLLFSLLFFSFSTIAYPASANQFSPLTEFGSSCFPLAFLSALTPDLQNVTIDYYSNPAKELDLLAKVLKFERRASTRTRSGEFFIIGIVSQKSDPISSWLTSDWLAFNNRLKQQPIRIGQLPVAIVEIDLDSFPPHLLEEKLRQEAVDFLYLGTLGSKKNLALVKNICRLCSKLKLGTFTANPEQLDSGVALAFSLTGAKPQIIINLEAARAQGLNFSSRLLHLVNIKKA